MLHQKQNLAVPLARRRQNAAVLVDSLHGGATPSLGVSQKKCLGRTVELGRLTHRQWQAAQVETRQKAVDGVMRRARG